MANNLLTDQHITQEALMILENNLTFTKQVDRQYSREFTAAKRGATVFVRKPPRYTVRDGQSVSVQDTVQSQVPIVLNHQFGVDVDFYSADLELSIDAFSKQILEPQMVAIANAIDYAGLGLWSQVPNVVGTAGTTPGSSGTTAQVLNIFTSAGAQLDKTATPRDQNRALVINEDAQAAVVPALSGLFQDAGSIAEQYKRGTMGTALGFKWSMSQNVNTYTTGAGGGAPKTNGTTTPATLPFGTSLSPASTTFSVGASASQGTFNVVSNGWTASTQVLNAGDVITFATCYAVNPVSYQQYSVLKKWVVASNVTSDGSGNATIPLTEPMIVTGPFKNCSNVPASAQNITIVTTAASTVSPQNLAFHKNAFTFASVDLPLPGGVHMAARKSDDQLGISMRFVAAYNVSTDQFIGRFDVLCGWQALRPEWACRILG